MKKKKRRLWVLLLLVVLLSGCAGSMEMETWLTPPRSMGIQSEIQRVLMTYTGGGWMLKYPRSGLYRAAITMIDLDADGNDEALVFCRKKNENGATHLMVLDTVESEWRVVGDIVGGGVDVEQVLVTRLDDSYQKSIVVSWDMLNRDKLGAVYYYQNGQLAQSGTEFMYTEMTVSDMDADGNDELFTILLNSAEMTATGRLLSRNVRTGRMQEIDSIQLDGNVLSYAGITYGLIWAYRNGIPSARGVCVDAVKSAGIMQTEIVYWDVIDGRLRLVDFERLEGRKPSGTTSIRAGTEQCCDIDNDGTMEFPVYRYCTQIADPKPAMRTDSASTATDTAHYTAWVHLVAANTAEPVLYTVQTPAYTVRLDPAVAGEWYQNLNFSYDETTQRLTFWEPISGSEVLWIQPMDAQTQTSSAGSDQAEWIPIRSDDAETCAYAYAFQPSLSAEQRSFWRSLLHLEQMSKWIVPNE